MQAHGFGIRPRLSWRASSVRIAMVVGASVLITGTALGQLSRVRVNPRRLVDAGPTGSPEKFVNEPSIAWDHATGRVRSRVRWRSGRQRREGGGGEGGGGGIFRNEDIYSVTIEQLNHGPIFN